MPTRPAFFMQVKPSAVKRHPRFSAFVHVVSAVPGLPKDLHAATALAWLETDPPGMRHLQLAWDRGLTTAVLRFRDSAEHAGLLGACIFEYMRRALRDPDGASWLVEIPGRRRWRFVPPRKRTATVHVWLPAGAPAPHATRREQFIHAVSDILRMKLTPPGGTNAARYRIVAGVLKATHGPTRSLDGLKADDAFARRLDPPRGGLRWPKPTKGRPKASAAARIYDARILRIVEDSMKRANAMLAYDPVVPFAAP